MIGKPNNNETEIRNAVIEATKLGYNDHGILDASLTLDYGDVVQMFGGWALDGKPATPGGERSPSDAAGFFISRILKTVGVDKWEDLKGTMIRVEWVDDYQIIRIGHILQDKWFNPKAEFKALREGTAK